MFGNDKCFGSGGDTNSFRNVLFAIAFGNWGSTVTAGILAHGAATTLTASAYTNGFRPALYLV